MNLTWSNKKEKNMLTKRMKISLIGGVILGLVCVLGANIRSNWTIEANFVFALWYNRVLMGLIVGAPWPKVNKNTAMFRGAVLGLLVSFAFYSATGYADPISFLAGIVYGVILEAVLFNK